MYAMCCRGGYIKRDGRPRQAETLTSRLVDRPLRPLLPSGWAHETQVRDASCVAKHAYTEAF